MLTDRNLTGSYKRHSVIYSVGDKEKSDSETPNDGNPSWLQNSDSNVSSKIHEESFDERSETSDP
jgi:hypothetical protein